MIKKEKKKGISHPIPSKKFASLTPIEVFLKFTSGKP